MKTKKSSRTILTVITLSIIGYSGMYAGENSSGKSFLRHAETTPNRAAGVHWPGDILKANPVTTKDNRQPTPKKATTKTAPATGKEKAGKSTETVKPKDIETGKNLIAKSDCLACHKIDEKLIGPSYNEVAGKYAANTANIDKLVSKVIDGGAGVWGPIPMSPHPALKKEEARAMVGYILSLKKK